MFIYIGWMSESGWGKSTLIFLLLKIILEAPYISVCTQECFINVMPLRSRKELTQLVWFDAYKIITKKLYSLKKLFCYLKNLDKM